MGRRPKEVDDMNALLDSERLVSSGAADELAAGGSSRFVRWARRHPLAAFVTLAYGLSWSAWVMAYLGGGIAMVVLGAFGPAAAAALVTYWSGGSIRGWLRPLTRWRVPARFYLYALGLPPALFASINVSLAVLGKEVDLGKLSSAIPAYLGTFLFVALLGGGQEEPGWRGFALDRFQARYSPVRATLLLGLVWGLWHLPLYGLWFLGPMLFVFFYTWLYNRTGSVLLCVLLHGSFTPALDHLVLVDDSLTVDAVIFVTLVAAAAVLVTVTRGRLGFDHRAVGPLRMEAPLRLH
jgi:membrane protease YdiL (CAAX protease family)